MRRNNFRRQNFFCLDTFLRQFIGVEIESLNSNYIWAYSVQSGKPKYNHLYILLWKCRQSLSDVKNWKIVITLSLFIMSDNIWHFGGAVKNSCAPLVSAWSRLSANHHLTRRIVRHLTASSDMIPLKTNPSIIIMPCVLRKYMKIFSFFIFRVSGFVLHVRLIHWTFHFFFWSIFQTMTLFDKCDNWHSLLIFHILIWYLEITPMIVIDIRCDWIEGCFV